MTDIPTTPAIEPPANDAATLAALPKRTLVLLAILVPAIVLTVILVISEHRQIRVADFADKAIPATFVASDHVWTSSRLTFSEQEMQILETRDYVYRTYTDGRNAPVELCVVFSEDNRKGTHPPDVCLEASGFHILTRQDRTLTLPDKTPLGVREVVTTASGQYLYFAYFYKCGDTFTTSFYQQQVQIVWNGLTHRNSAGALIRYSTPMANSNDLAAARNRTDQLIALTFPSIRDNLR